MQRADISLQPNCLKKDNILSSKQFKIAFDGITKKIYTKYFTFLLAENISGSSSVGIIIAKKKVKTAVQRNKCRRIVKEGFRHNKHLFINTNVIALATKSAANAEKSELWLSVNEFLQRLTQ